jgi:hypothetical protein
VASVGEEERLAEVIDEGRRSFGRVRAAVAVGAH